MVGGFGTRLRPLTLTTPKQMLPIVHRPMIEHVLGHLAEHGIDDAVLGMGYKPDAFSDAYPDGVCGGVVVHYAVEPEPLDTAGAIRFAALDAGITERFLVVNGDVLTDLDIGALIEFHVAHGAEGTIALHRVEDPSAFGVVPTDDDGRVLAFVEKPPRHEAPTDLINAGTYVLEPSVLDRIDAGRKVSIERETFPEIVADGRLYAAALDTYWIDTGTPAKYLEAQLDLLVGVRGPALSGVSADAEVAGDAVVEESVVSAGATIEAGAVVRRSVVMGGATVGAGARLDHAIVGPDARIGAGAVLTEATVLGAGAVADAGEHLAGVKRPSAG
ncbi:MAG: Mannose-phosphate guanylyltransferase [Acidimicrobiales bacterium]|nr:Mannose-phosphate guanylyltransferase [Acidimicrobiales bacterium]